MYPGTAELTVGLVHFGRFSRSYHCTNVSPILVLFPFDDQKLAVLGSVCLRATANPKTPPIFL